MSGTLGYSTSVVAELSGTATTNGRQSGLVAEVHTSTGGLGDATMLAVEVASRSGGNAGSTGLFAELLVEDTTIGPYVPDRFPVWTVKPNWFGKVTQRLRWLTAVRQSQTGVEQRARMRNAPRREIDVLFSNRGAERRLVDAMMMGQGGGIFHFPLWWDKRSLMTAVSKGDVQLNIDVSYSEFQPGCLILILGPSPFIYEVLTVNAVAPYQLILGNTTAQDWVEGTSVYVLRQARIVNQSVATRKSGDIYELPLTFEIVGTNDWPTALDDSVVDWHAAPLPFKPADMNDLTLEYQRLFAELDNTTGIGARRDVGLQAFQIQTLDQALRGRQQYFEWKQFLYWLNGKAHEFFLPTFFRDVEYLYYATSQATDNFIFINRCGLAERMGYTTPGRKLLQMVFKDGTVLIKTILNAAVTSPDVESVALDSPLGKAFGPSDIARISYGTGARSDQDDVEIVHETDILGTATCTMTFRTIADTVRVSVPYSLAYYTGSYIQNPDPPAIPDTELPQAPPVDTAPPLPGGLDYSGGGEGDGGGGSGGGGGGSSGL